MIQLNFYKKRCSLTDSEKNMINVFFKALFKVDEVTDIHIYLVEGDCIAEIEGFETPKSIVVGSIVKEK